MGRFRGFASSPPKPAREIQNHFRNETRKQRRPAAREREGTVKAHRAVGAIRLATRHRDGGRAKGYVPSSLPRSWRRVQTWQGRSGALFGLTTGRLTRRTGRDREGPDRLSEGQAMKPAFAAGLR